MGVRSPYWNVFHLDHPEEPDKFCGFFADQADAQGWVDQQEGGTYEVSQRKVVQKSRASKPEQDDAKPATSDSVSEEEANDVREPDQQP